MASRQKGPPTSFSVVTPTNVGIRLQNFLTYSFNLFIKAIASAIQIIELVPTAPLKTLVFLVQS